MFTFELVGDSLVYYDVISILTCLWHLLSSYKNNLEKQRSPSLLFMCAGDVTISSSELIYINIIYMITIFTLTTRVSLKFVRIYPY